MEHGHSQQSIQSFLSSFDKSEPYNSHQSNVVFHHLHRYNSSSCIALTFQDCYPLLTDVLVALTSLTNQTYFNATLLSDEGLGASVAQSRVHHSLTTSSAIRGVWLNDDQITLSTQKEKVLSLFEYLKRCGCPIEIQELSPALPSTHLSNLSISFNPNTLISQCLSNESKGEGVARREARLHHEATLAQLEQAENELVKLHNQLFPDAQYFKHCWFMFDLPKDGSSNHLSFHVVVDFWNESSLCAGLFEVNKHHKEWWDAYGKDDPSKAEAKLIYDSIMREFDKCPQIIRPNESTSDSITFWVGSLSILNEDVGIHSDNQILMHSNASKDTTSNVTSATTTSYSVLFTKIDYNDVVNTCNLLRTASLEAVSKCLNDNSQPITYENGFEHGHSQKQAYPTAYHFAIGLDIDGNMLEQGHDNDIRGMFLNYHRDDLIYLMESPVLPFIYGTMFDYENYCISHFSKCNELDFTESLSDKIRYSDHNNSKNSCCPIYSQCDFMFSQFAIHDVYFISPRRFDLRNQLFKAKIVSRPNIALYWQLADKCMNYGLNKLINQKATSTVNFEYLAKHFYAIFNQLKQDGTVLEKQHYFDFTNDVDLLPHQCSYVTLTLTPYEVNNFKYTESLMTYELQLKTHNENGSNAYEVLTDEMEYFVWKPMTAVFNEMVRKYDATDDSKTVGKTSPNYTDAELIEFIKAMKQVFLTN